MTRKSLGPIGRMQKGPVGTHRMEKGPNGDFYDELQASRMSNRLSHRYMSDGGRTSGDFYDKLEASQMSNYRSHRYMSDG